MTEAAKEARRAYRRQWYKDHPGKQKEYTARYWENQAKKAQEPAGDPAADPVQDPAGA